jgi:dissimilatory sulfite reductase (desulfoviridin) alpha/beta subunit
MEWTERAEKDLKKIPFFIRKKIRCKVEDYAIKNALATVTHKDLKAVKAACLSDLNPEIQGYQIETCFGHEGCPNRAEKSDHLVEHLEYVFEKEDLRTFLSERVKGDLKPHHEIRIAVADCPNACSQPQIKDIGIIGASLPETTNRECISCNACLDICRERAITINDSLEKPEIDCLSCLKCGQCADVCTTGSIVKGISGFRVMLGGKLGRHPKLARELPGIYDEASIIKIVKNCIRFYKEHNRHGERFAEIVSDVNIEDFLC